jgi:hypothetical protein
MLHRGVVPFLVVLLARDANAQCTIARQRVQVGIISTAYIANALVGARMAIHDSLPQSPFGIRTGRTPSADFYCARASGDEAGTDRNRARERRAARRYGGARVSELSIAMTGR